MKEIGIYVHIPFCKSKCYYCDFASYENKGQYIERYIKAIKTEINNVGKRARQNLNGNYSNLPIAKTIYVGGGTPSFISEKYIEEIFNAINTNFEISPNAEITIEVNPRNSYIRKNEKIS